MADTCNLSGNLDLLNPLKIFKSCDLNEPQTSNIEGLIDYQQIGSYNWFGTREKPVMIVPGAPKRFVQWNGGQLNRDVDNWITDENHYRMPLYPMEPLFQAIKLCNENEEETIKFQNFDIVTNRNHLRKLFNVFGFSNGDQPSSSQTNHRLHHGKEFRIDVKRIGRLICLVRCPETILERASDSHHSTFGQDFEQKCSKPFDDTKQRSFHQIVKYKFGNLKLIVSFEVDCADYAKSTFIQTMASKPDKQDESDSPTDSMKKLTLSPDSKKMIPYSILKSERLPHSELSIIKNGDRYNYHFIELATRVYFCTFPRHTWPQMFFSGTETLVIGWQKFGKVEPNGWVERGKVVREKGVEVFKVEKVLKEFGGLPKAGLYRLHNFLVKLVELIRQQEEQKTFSIYWKPGFDDEIKIFEVIDANQFVVPEELKHFISNH